MGFYFGLDTIRKWVDLMIGYLNNCYLEGKLEHGKDIIGKMQQSLIIARRGGYLVFFCGLDNVQVIVSVRK